MPSRLFALLVGINDYPASPLAGCVNDVKRFEEFLLEAPRVEPPEILKLTDRGATRRAMVDAFRSHLAAARAGDVALFYYSGHGSREYAPRLYSSPEPSGLSETLVAVDSREVGGQDLADKELAVLIAEVAAREAHMVVILDSCHSGTATRKWEPEREDGAVRQYERGADPRYRDRLEGSYWFDDPAAVPVGLDCAGGWHVLPPGRHVLLAACEDRQTAREAIDPEGRPCGLFSLSLLTAWSRLGRPANYREWLKPTIAEVFARNPNQTPEGRGDLNRLPLDGTLGSRRATFHLLARRGAWELDAGRLHGLQSRAELAVFPAGAADLRDLSASIASVRLTEVGAGDSRIEPVEGSLPEAQGALPAVLTQLPHPALSVAVRLRHGELTRRIEQSPFLLRAVVAELAAVEVWQRAGRWYIERRDNRRLFPIEATGAEERVAVTVAALEQIARWETLAALTNPQDVVPVDGKGEEFRVEMTALAWQPPVQDGGEPVLIPLKSDVADLPYSHGRPGRFAVRLENKGKLAAYCALLGLSESFAIRPIDGADEVRLEPGESVVLRRFDGISASVPDEPGRPDPQSCHDLLLLLASERKVDFSLLAQGRLFSDSPHRQKPWRVPPSVLDALLWGIRRRDFDSESRPLSAYRWTVARQWIVAKK